MTEMQNYIDFTDTTASKSFTPDPWGKEGPFTNGEDNSALIHGLIGVANEAGELLGLYKKAAFNSKEVTRDQIADELGDVLWYMARVLRGIDMSFEELAARNTAKLTTRHAKLYEDAKQRKAAELRAQVRVARTRPSSVGEGTPLDIHAFNGA